MTGRKLYESTRGRMAFWFSNIGMIGMTVAFGVAGVAQVYLERKFKMDFMVVQKEIEIHFVVLILCATLFLTGIILYFIDFYKHGRPTDEALEVKND
jgi:nitric oxide reductase subunit B